MNPNRADCESLLSWAMPLIGLDWKAHHNVRRQVYKRLRRRIFALGLRDAEEYRSRLLEELPHGAAEAAEGYTIEPSLPPEWGVLAALCRVTVSRFYRDREVFRALRTDVLPRLAETALSRGADELRCWCAGCGAGEEVYSLALLWSMEEAPRTLAVEYPELRFEILGTDAHPGQLQRARRAVYPRGVLREAPLSVVGALETSEAEVRVPVAFRRCVSFLEQDLRREQPVGRFDLILCRNMAFSYFDAADRRWAAHTLCEALVPGGVLVLGRGERLPPEARTYQVLSG